MTSTVKFDVVPTTVNDRLKREMTTSMVHTARLMHGTDYKYNYDFGVKKTGDGLLDIKQNSYQWMEPYDVELIIKCIAPREQPIQFVSIRADQSSLLHEGKIIAGGIGEDFIEILITARNTYWFKYDARFYGRASFLLTEKKSTT